MIKNWFNDNNELFKHSSSSCYAFLIDCLMQTNNIDLLNSKSEVIECYTLKVNHKKYYTENKKSQTQTQLINGKNEYDNNYCISGKNELEKSLTQHGEAEINNKNLIQNENYVGIIYSQNNEVKVSQLKVRYYLNIFECFFKQTNTGMLELDKIIIENDDLLNIFYLNKNKNKIKKQLEYKLKVWIREYSSSASQKENLIDLD